MPSNISHTEPSLTCHHLKQLLFGLIFSIQQQMNVYDWTVSLPIYYSTKEGVHGLTSEVATLAHKTFVHRESYEPDWCDERIFEFRQYDP